jgi:hypothetical protein
MGFMDKAKKLAEQAQTKLDEAQKQFNQQQSGGGSGAPQAPVTEYDQHGRPIPRSEPEAATPPHGDPLAEQAETAPPPAPSAPVPDPAAPQAAAPPPGPPEPEDRNNPSYAPPKLSGGDPLK